MTRRRFMLVVVALVAVNTFFLFAQGGLALPKAVITQFFGNQMVRAEVVLKNGQDWHLDRGVVQSFAGGTVTLKEPDTTIVSIPVSPSARIQGARLIRPRMRVVVYHQANIPAEIVQVEGAGGGLALPKAVITQFFGNQMVRAEVVLKNGQDWHLDRGVVQSFAGGTVTLREPDTTIVSIPVSPSARIQGARQIRPRMRVVVYHQANIPAEIVQVEGVGG